MNIERDIQSHALSDMEILCVLDGYEPHLAQIVIDTIREQSEGTITVLWDFAADRAMEDSTWN